MYTDMYWYWVKIIFYNIVWACEKKLKSIAFAAKAIVVCSRCVFLCWGWDVEQRACIGCTPTPLILQCGGATGRVRRRRSRGAACSEKDQLRRVTSFWQQQFLRSSRAASPGERHPPSPSTSSHPTQNKHSRPHTTWPPALFENPTSFKAQRVWLVLSKYLLLFVWMRVNTTFALRAAIGPKQKMIIANAHPGVLGNGRRHSLFNLRNCRRTTNTRAERKKTPTHLQHARASPFFIASHSLLDLIICGYLLWEFYDRICSLALAGKNIVFCFCSFFYIGVNSLLVLIFYKHIMSKFSNQYFRNKFYLSQNSSFIKLFSTVFQFERNGVKNCNAQQYNTFYFILFLLKKNTYTYECKLCLTLARLWIDTL